MLARSGVPLSEPVEHRGVFRRSFVVLAGWVVPKQIGTSPEHCGAKRFRYTWWNTVHLAAFRRWPNACSAWVRLGGPEVLGYLRRHSLDYRAYHREVRRE